MKIIFLDIDGVLNSEEYVRSERFKNKGGLIDIDSEAVKILDRILDETGAKIVLSSTWRLDKGSRDKVRSDVGEFIDVTPVSVNRIRGNEVNLWLKDRDDVERYAILDDDSDFHDYQPLFKTTFKLGLTDKIADEVIEYLNKS